ncbi:YraN family protein [Cardinium endosymbiont of Tipula unca]|uniref:YraN family protein n=1 Tax=Cardinium endosymbiont of Tipula unca TaxID=3066216 RepID=UPI0030CD6075
MSRNFRYKRFEIDLIVSQGNMIVFVEVKAHKNNLFGNPEDFVNKKKIRAYRIAATYYLVDPEIFHIIWLSVINILYLS